MTVKKALEILDSLFETESSPSPEELKEAIELAKESLKNSTTQQVNEERFKKAIVNDLNDMYKKESSKYLFTADFLKGVRRRYATKN